MKRTAMWTAAAVLVLAGGLLAYQVALAGGERADCPGKILCPITGEEVCKDQCPLIDPARPDCPGRIECPLTGELVCRDRCPLRSDEAKADIVPNCCQGRE
ncbi:MAG: hypothetical protein HYY18_22665 [Planctomycetes bacterium]|nr:hypothetical protein [Planctomycetota bacterium]